MTFPIEPELIQKMYTDWRNYLIRRRQELIMELGSIEEILGLERSIVPRHKRDNHREQSTGDDVV